MTLQEEWEALDAPEPTPTTSLQAEWDALDAPEPTPAATPVDLRKEWDELDAAPTLPTPEPQGLAALGGGDPLKGIDWEQVKKNAPAVIPAVAAIGTGGMSLPAQAAVSLAAGAAGRYFGDEDPLKLGSLTPSKILEGGILPDMAMPVLPNVAIGAAKGLVAPLIKDTYSGVRTAIDDILDWRKLPDVDLTEAVARPIDVTPPTGLRETARDAADTVKELIGSPIVTGGRSEVPEFRDLASRLQEFPEARNRLSRFVERSEKDIFSTKMEGFRGKALGRRTVMPLAEREDVKFLMEGFRKPEDVSEGARTAATKLGKFYEDLGELGERFGIINEKAPRIKGYSGPNIPRPETAEEVASLAEQTAVQHGKQRALGFKPRTDKFDPTFHIVDPLEGFHAYTRRAPEQFAAARSFGPQAAGTSEGTKAFGVYANELLNRGSAGALSRSEQARRDTLARALQQIYQVEPGKGGRVLGGIGQAVGTSLLPLSWANQIGQAGWNVGRYGLQNTVEGMIRYARDPELRALIEASGARGSSMQHLFEEMRPGTKNIVGSMIGGSEAQLRGLLSAGQVPYSEKLITRALDAAAGPGRLSRGLSRQLAEMGIEDINTVPYQPSASLERDAFARVVGRTQLMSGDPGHSSAWLTGNPVGRLFGQFKSFPLGAARLFATDVGAPLLSGIRNRDTSELALALGRLARLAPAGVGAAAVAETLKGAQRGGNWDYSKVPEQTFETIGGMPAGLLMEVLRGKTLSKGGLNAIKSLSPPIASIPERLTWKSLGLLGLNTALPGTGSAVSMLTPAIREAGKKKEDPVKRLRRQIEEIRKNARAGR